MRKANIIQLYPSGHLDSNNRMSQETNIQSENSEELNLQDLRLLSINKASKLLGIRFETVQKLVKNGSIKSIRINNKNMISYYNLVEFLRGKSMVEINAKVMPVEDTQARIDNLLQEYAG